MKPFTPKQIKKIFTHRFFDLAERGEVPPEQFINTMDYLNKLPAEHLEVEFIKNFPQFFTELEYNNIANTNYQPEPLSTTHNEILNHQSETYA